MQAYVTLCIYERRIKGEEEPDEVIYLVRERKTF
jgi:hypothetical protein